MTISIDATDAIGAGRLDRRVLVIFSLVATFIVAVALRHFLAANNDVSWLLTAGEHVLAGDKLYAGVIETNPPIAVLAYIPAIVIAHAIGMSPEIVTDALVFIGIAVSLGITALILRRSAALKKLHNPVLLVLAFAVLTVMPMLQFGQREHIALVGCLPVLAVLLRRAQDETPERWALVIAGLGAGVTLAFKPHFAFGIFCAVAAIAMMRRSWRPFSAPENLIAGVLFVVYVMGIAVFFPEYFTAVTPLVRAVYVPVGMPFSRLIVSLGVLCWVSLLLFTVTLQRQRFNRSVLVLAAASVGFALAFFLQHKGWAYQSYPMLALAFMALGAAIVLHPFESGRVAGLGAVSALVLIFGNSLGWFMNGCDAGGLQPHLAPLANKPAILAITGEPGIGHPAVRALNGTWVSREASLWITAHVNYMKTHGGIAPGQEDRLRDYVARERAWLIEDIKQHPPTIVLVDNLTGQWGAWLRADTELSDLLKSYKKVDSFDRIDVLTRTEAAVTSR